jgi:hypothetical protein
MLETSRSLLVVQVYFGFIATYHRWHLLLLDFHGGIDTAFDLLCSSLAIATPIDAGGHTGDHTDKINHQFILCLGREKDFQAASLGGKKGFDGVIAEARQPIAVLNHNGSNTGILQEFHEFGTLIVES